MGAVPSRETLRRGLYVVRQPTSGSHGSSKKQDIVLIPLTKEFFPSPDCALFVQFHRARCDAGVNYYFRRPGNPGDLSRIPATDSSDDDVSYPSREVLYRGVVERVEEMLFDTDEEMRQAHERALGGAAAAATGDAKKRVLPILCAVAFRYDPNKLSQQLGGGNNNLQPHLQAVLEQGVFLCGSIVNIVGCFGFVPMEVEGVQVASVSAASQGNASGGSHTYHSAKSPGHPSLRDGSVLASHRSSLLSPPLMSPPQPPQERHKDPSAAVSGPYQRLAAQRTPTCASSYASTPSYDPHQQHRSRVTSARPPTAVIQLQGIAGENYRHFASLPPPVAAPLAAIVFLTKSAGEQNLSRVTFMAASTYYNQLIEAGVLQSPAPQGAHPSRYPKNNMPPLDTFSFSSLMTNVPILSFVYEMRCRWQHLGLLSDPGSGGHSRSNSLSSSTILASSAVPPYLAREDMEMWITDDNMFHGRIGKELAERLCYSLAEKPEVISRRVEPLPGDDTFWRFRGLVDRNCPPPLPRSEGGDTDIDELDVYVMGAAVMDGFDEGDVLRFDTEHHLWVADRTIPLDAVVLAAVRPHSRAAREAPPDDPGWVMRPEDTEDEEEAEEEVETELEEMEETKANGVVEAGSETACEDRAEGATEKKKRQVHVRKGNFYIYRFELNGRTYYHGTVPDFANPNKKNVQQALLASEKLATGVGAAKGTPLLSPNSASFKEEIQQQNGSRGGAARDAKLPSITSALFSLMPDGAADEGEAEGVAYLPTRVKSVAIDAARRWMGTLFQYAMGGHQVAGSTASIPRSSGVSTPVSRRQATFVEVGPGAMQNALSQEGVEEGKGFVKRFVHDTKYVWDWRRS
ncbi:hypothetical protein DQ04_01571140 [Trypanosoma grayi]|uniref:hypothetical protein n=1 Tax=Trypanosoma grayi TaxID=71804 RepID=UPI0004F40BDC|nr:hypothetical protein DQ04_01571140 [Trypanosoma grayi]KEG12631.1 hypothetical protein DQ04_01571140 [Trypanosoma grayi]